MAYSSDSKYPFERASKSSHTQLINDKQIASFLERCEIPKSSEEVKINQSLIEDVDYTVENPIKQYITIDGGVTTTNVKKSFPSSKITFFQFGFLLFKNQDLHEVSQSEFIAPEDISRLKNIERIKLVLPTKNIPLKGGYSLTNSVRKVLHEFFSNYRDDKYCLYDSLKWFIYRKFQKDIDDYQLASCPKCSSRRVNINQKKIDNKFTFECEECGDQLFLIDVFRLHEAIDDELGALGIVGYLTNLIEQFLIIHTIFLFLKVGPEYLKKSLFIKDGPLAFFGQTANMHKPMRDLINYLSTKTGIHLVGVEKSGAFVEHANEIKDLIKPGQYLILNNEHIYKYIIPGSPKSDAYGNTSYYSSKILFKTRNGNMLTLTLPTESSDVILNPSRNDFKNINVILKNLELMKCDMYANSLFPVALANKLVSLSDHPSQKLLENFAKKSIQ